MHPQKYSEAQGAMHKAYGNQALPHWLVTILWVLAIYLCEFGLVKKQLHFESAFKVIFFSTKNFSTSTFLHFEHHVSIYF